MQLVLAESGIADVFWISHPFAGSATGVASMVGLKWVAWGCFGLALVGFVLGVNTGFYVLFAGGLTAAVTGVFFLALDRIVTLLGEIAAAVKDGSPAAAPAAGADSQEAAAAPSRSIADIQADLDRLRAKV